MTGKRLMDEVEKAFAAKTRPDKSWEDKDVGYACAVLDVLEFLKSRVTSGNDMMDLYNESRRTSK